MTDFEGNVADTPALQDQWDQRLAEEGLQPVESPDTLGLPPELFEAQRRIEEQLGSTTIDELVIATVDDLRKSGVHIRTLGFHRWNDLSEALIKHNLTEMESVDELDDEVEPVDRTAETPFEVSATSLLPDEIQRLLSPLDEHEREVLRMRFGLDRGEPRTLDEVGESFNLTRDRIREIEMRAMSKMMVADQLQVDKLIIPES